MAYLPTASAESGFIAGLNMGSTLGAASGDSPGARPVLPRSSSHRAQGQASRRNRNEWCDRCPSFHSMSTPVPVVRFTLTDFGSADAINSVSHSREYDAVVGMTNKLELSNR